MDGIEVRKYTITGLVDYTDEQGNIVGQFEVGSVQELPVFVGDKAVAAGQAEVFEGEEEVDEEAAGGDDTTTTDETNTPDADEVAGPEARGAVDEGQDEVAGADEVDLADMPGADDANDDTDLDEEEDEDGDEDESEEDDTTA